MKGQVSNELLVVVGFILLVIIPLLYVMYFKMDDIRTDLAMLQVHFSAARIAFAINAVGHMGDGSSLITEIYIPENVDSVSISGNEVVFTTIFQGESNDIVQATEFGVELNPDVEDVFVESGEGVGSGRYRLELFNEGGTIVLSPQPSPEQT